jgi:hypothetical protein
MRCIDVEEQHKHDSKAEKYVEHTAAYFIVVFYRRDSVQNVSPQLLFVNGSVHSEKPSDRGSDQRGQGQEKVEGDERKELIVGCDEGAISFLRVL